MKLARHDLVAALSLRYDHYSSQSMFEAACKRANLGDQDQFTASDVAAFRAALAKLGDRLQRVDDRLDSLLGELPAQATAPVPAPDVAEPDSATPAASSMPAQAPQEASKPAQVPQASKAPASATTRMPATETSKAAESAKPAQAPQAPPMPAPEGGKPGQAPQATAPTPAPSTEAGETRIVLSGVELADGDALFVCGDSVELGNWEPERARPMRRDGDDWSAVVPRGAGTFKFLRRTEEGAVIWESGENREIGAAVKIETSWQSVKG